MIIYKITNKINKKVYIGQTTKELGQRIAEHLCVAKNGGYLIHQSIRKYGIKSFEFSIIDNASLKEILDAKEKYWIGQYNCKAPNGYNLTDGGEGNTGWHPTEETCRKLSEANIGKHPTEDTRIKLRAAKIGNKNHNFGKHFSAKHRQNISVANLGEKSYNWGKPGTMLGKHHNEDARRKMSEARKAKIGNKLK